ncbi:hypothetical protein FXB40_14085 [Bradyrhizobium rifense]|uniref:Uncharacterized protein n=1 Tax=Bradyrhizobium rifense TaxID=515499 RepID=A0A5D3KFK1_9BRAD|nr:hypothetical protein FXB40_14085 [Bradyrhizobium rifense]
MRRSNPDCLRGKTLDCFAALAMTECVAASRQFRITVHRRARYPQLAQLPPRSLRGALATKQSRLSLRRDSGLLRFRRRSSSYGGQGARNDGVGCTSEGYSASAFISL